MRESRSIASWVAPNDETVSPKPASAVPSDTVSRQKSLVQLRGEFRESQRCLDERVTVRANLGNGSGTMPPHIPGCDELKIALRRLYEATRAAAQAGDLDAQMCYLMQRAPVRSLLLNSAVWATIAEMGLTRKFKKTVVARIERDPVFAKALLDEAANLFLSGELKVARVILRDLLNTTLGFEQLARFRTWARPRG
jgi:hypothetical protein